MYAGGTMAALVARGHRVAVRSFSHGEGGRLVERTPEGAFVERRDYPRAHVARVRDEEFAEACRRGGVDGGHLHAWTDEADFDWTTDLTTTLQQWQVRLPNGLTGAVERLVRAVITLRPQVVLTFDPRDDPHGSGHGHHKALAHLADVACRLAGQKVLPDLTPHVVAEVWAFAPQGAVADFELPVDVPRRLAMVEAYGSQFLPRDLEGFARRPTESFCLRWRAGGLGVPPGGSRLKSLLG
jgi:LmbE family N-acetylglucosaminyl deacetylase